MHAKHTSSSSCWYSRAVTSTQPFCLLQPVELLNRPGKMDPWRISFILPSVKSTSACGLKMALEREGMPVNMINPTYFWGEEGYKGYVAGYKEDALVN
eukprot:18771-Heterococcus_DN1.PRE.3